MATVGPSAGGARSGAGALMYSPCCLWARWWPRARDPQIKAFSERLLAVGNVKKVALTACMHTLLTILNAMLKHRTPWQPQEVQNLKKYTKAPLTIKTVATLLRRCGHWRRLRPSVMPRKDALRKHEARLGSCCGDYRRCKLWRVIPDRANRCAQAPAPVCRRVRRRSRTYTLNEVWQRAKEIGKSACGSWLGYQANVYYKDFKAPPAGEHSTLSTAQRARTSPGRTRTGFEHTAQDVFDLLVDANGKTALAAAEQAAEQGLALLNSVKADVSSVLTVYLSDHDDPFVRRIADEIEKAKVLDAADIANQMSPKRQMITRDMRAVQQGTWAPPHIKVQARVTAAHQPAAHCLSWLDGLKSSRTPLSYQATRSACGSGRNKHLHWPWTLSGLERPQGLRPGSTSFAVRRVQSRAGCWYHQYRAAVRDA